MNTQHPASVTKRLWGTKRPTLVEYLSFLAKHETSSFPAGFSMSRSQLLRANVSFVEVTPAYQINHLSVIWMQKVTVNDDFISIAVEDNHGGRWVGMWTHQSGGRDYYSLRPATCLFSSTLFDPETEMPGTIIGADMGITAGPIFVHPSRKSPILPYRSISIEPDPKQVTFHFADWRDYNWHPCDDLEPIVVPLPPQLVLIRTSDEEEGKDPIKAQWPPPGTPPFVKRDWRQKLPA